MEYEIIKQIETLRAELIIRLGRYPKNLYLGTIQMKQLQEYIGYLSGFGIEYFKPKDLSSIRATYNGMTVYTVDADDHLNLG